MARKKKAAKPKKRKAPAGGKPEGRPKIEVDAETLRNLCAIQCTQAEIATVLQVSRKTVERWAQQPQFAEIFANGRELGKVSVRRQQFKLLEAGSVAMAIWLGKQLLGQKDEVKATVDASSITYAGLLGIIDRIESKRHAKEDERQPLDRVN